MIRALSHTVIIWHTNAIEFITIMKAAVAWMWCWRVSGAHCSGAHCWICCWRVSGAHCYCSICFLTSFHYFVATLKHMLNIFWQAAIFFRENMLNFFWQIRAWRQRIGSQFSATRGNKFWRVPRGEYMLNFFWRKRAWMHCIVRRHSRHFIALTFVLDQ